MNISALPRNVSVLHAQDKIRQPHAGAPRFARSLTLAAMSLGYVVVQLDVTIVNVAINSIGASYGGSLADLQWIVNAYTITFAAFILTAGALGDRVGARRVFHRGFRDLRARFAGLRARADSLGPDCCPAMPGHRRGGSGTKFTGAVEPRLPQ